MTLVLSANIALLCAAGICVLYIVVLTVAAGTVKLRGDFRTTRLRRFAFVVPAHNEEAVIGRTLRSLQGLEYPREGYEIVVVADNCSDRTAVIAAEHGATVMERVDAVRRGKGYALRWAFDRLLREREEIDGFVVIDADSTVSANYLAVLNGYVEDGSLVVQTADLVDPGGGQWNTKMTRIGFLLYNYVRPLGRKALGCSVGLRGNGMCFTRGILKDIPWDAYSIAEDLEYGLRLLMRGVTVTFAPEATVLAHMPAESRDAVSQRARWEGGRIGVGRRYALPMLRAVFARGCVRCIDAFLDLLTPALVNLIAFCMLMGVVSALLLAAGADGMAELLAGWVMLSVLCLGHLLAGLRIAGAERELYRELIHIPRYAMWKVGVYFSTRARRKSEWIRTSRES